MATPGSVVKRVAELFQVPVGAVTEIDRALADAGGRDKGGRGRSAIQLGPRDVAHLLITAAASPLWGPTTSRARATYFFYSSLPLASGPIGRDVGLPSLQNLRASHTISDAITALVASAVTGELQMALDEHRAHSADVPKLFVAFCSPVATAQIKIALRGETVRLDYRRTDSKLRAYRDSFKSEFSEPGDLSQVREFSYRTLLAVGDLIAGRATGPRELA
jgi:hypothetical protein